MRIGHRFLAVWVVLLPWMFQPAVVAQSNGSLRGKVTLKETGQPLHHASVSIEELDRSTVTGDDGNYEFDGVPAGTYHLITHLDSLFTEVTTMVNVDPGAAAEANIFLELLSRRYEVTVTASDEHETVFESFQSVESLGPYQMAESADVTIGELLDHKVGSGIAKRGFGPGPARPIIRGFDGDRVLIMEDGIRSGSLSSQSGDHGELINPAQLERLEVVKGPATLLYSGSSMGGTVNAISRHHQVHHHPHEGVRGFISGSAGTNNSLGGVNAGFELGAGDWLFWGQGGGMRTGDYTAPGQGAIYNSRSKIANGGGGFGFYGEKMFFSVEAKYDDGIYGVPFVQEFHGHHGEEEEHHDEEEGEHHDEDEDHDDDEDHDEEEGEHHDEEDEHGHEEEEEIDRIQVDAQRLSYRFNWGLKDLGGALDHFALKLAYTDWSHDEIEFLEDGDRIVGTEFDNTQFTYRGVFEQRESGPLSGSFGFWGLARDYSATGEEALSPPVTQNGFALFALQVLDFETFKLQFGGRLETQRYHPGFAERSAGHGHEEEEEHHDEEAEHEMEEDHDEEVADAVERTFTGASASVGIHADTWQDGAFVVNYSHSYRAPSLEELYNFGPHAGNLAFEIGDPFLDAETGDGIELSLRHEDDQVHGSLSFFYYGFQNFIFPFAPGEEEDGLQVIEFTQRDARYVGAEAAFGFRLNPVLWLDLGLDRVDAQDTNTGTPLPRIPPLRGKIGLDFNLGGLRINPELIVAGEQNQTFTGETRTPGYGVVNLKASYTYAQQHVAHQFAVNVFNLGDRLYRNHSSFIKDLAPEIGRGVRVTYIMRFF